MKILGYEITKARNTPNKMYQAQFDLMMQNQPVWHQDNNHEYLSKGYNYNADLFSIVNYVATTASAIPWKLYTIKENGELAEIKNHPLIDLMERPNPDMGQSLFINSLIGYKMLLGNSYIYAPKMDEGLNKGKAQELHVLPADLIEIVFGNVFDPVKGYVFKYHPEKQKLEMDKKDVLHLKTWNPDSAFGQALYGMSPIKAALRLLTKSNSAYASETKAFQNQGAAGIVSSEKDADLTLEQATKLKMDWERKKGTEHANSVQFTSAPLRYLKIGLSPVDLNILESQKVSFRQFCNIFKFPSILLNDNEKSSYNNIVEAKKILYQDVIIPELKALRDEFNRWLVPAYGQNLYLDPDFSGVEALQENMKEKAEWLNIAWWVKGVDKQRLMGITEDKELDKYFMPANILEHGAEPPTPENIEDELKKLGIEEYK